MPTTWVTDRLRTVRDWWRAYNPAVWDRWLAALFVVLAFVPALSRMGAEFGDLPLRPADAFSFVLVLAATLPLAVRHRWPLACLVSVGLSFAIYESMAYQPQFSTVTVYIALYSAGARQERFRHATAAAATGAFIVLCLVLTALGTPDGLVAFLLFYSIFVFFWLLGTFVRQRRADEAERRRLAAVAATATERARIARELHDVVTHHVTAIVVQSDATRFLVQSPDRVINALDAMGGTGRQALAELRYLLDVLEATGDSGLPVQRTIRDLVEQTRLAGQPVELIEDGDPPTLPAKVGLAVYRVVQEGLTNAVKYATGQPTEVHTNYRDGQIEVAVTTAPTLVTAGAPAGPSGGRGLKGLRERVTTLGGGLTTGEQPDGRFRIHAMIPITGDE
jgi:signal transduction histidine kinase